MEIDLRLQHQLLAVESEHHVNAMVELVAPEAPGGEARSPLRVALVIDRSGSMHGDKLHVIKQCAGYLAGRLEGSDELAVVAYDDAVELISPLAKVDVDVLRARISSIMSGGTTNLSGGWLKGVEELGRRDDGVHRVLLLTDGLANEGITDPDTLVSMARNAAETDISTTTIGFGEGFNEDLLTAMADAGGGSARYVASLDEAPAIFADEFDGLVALSAQNVSIEIRPAEAVQMIGVLNDYATVRVDGGVQMAVGDAFAGQELRVVFQLVVPTLASLGVMEIADVVVRYVDVTFGVSAHEVTHPLLANLVSADDAAAAEVDAIVEDEALVLSSARAVSNAQRLADQGELDLAREVLAAAVQDLRMVGGRSERGTELLRAADRLSTVHNDLEQGSYAASTRKLMHYSSRDMHRHKRRRGS